ncbi:MAG: hypothetical protein EXQ98_08510 [Alphaproteobacteria bacterium]|nr:hypothetical protein [Alphaproteobacteria bacterium]
MTGMKRALFGAIIAASVLLGTTLSSLAADLPIKAFFCTWSGSGLARNEESDYFGLTIRDLDVTLQAAGQGFTLSWTTVMREGGDPKNPNVKRKSESLNFQPTERPGIFAPKEASRDPIAGGRTMWARVKGQTLTVSTIAVLDDGGFELQRYDRTLTDLGMELDFISMHDHGVARHVTGRLTKQAN